MAGVTTCLWQAFPTKTNAEITQLIKESAHLYNSPTAQEGYGIPNFQSIYNSLLVEESDTDNSIITAYPNPSKDIIYFSFPENINSFSIAVFDVLGKLINTKIIDKINPSYNVSELSEGLYFIQTQDGNEFNTIKFIKN